MLLVMPAQLCLSLQYRYYFCQGVRVIPKLCFLGVVALIILLTKIVDRALFYVSVIPTTIPGAFFWRNQGFQKHARKTGLVNVVDAGILGRDH